MRAHPQNWAQTGLSLGISIAVTQQSLFLPTPIALRLGGAFVVVLFALGDAEFDFDPTLMVEIHHQRDKRHALSSCGLPKAGQLAFRDQEFALAAFFMWEHRLLIGRDVGIGQPKFAIIDRGVALGDVGLAGPHGFDLGTRQDNAAFYVILDGIVIAGPPIFGDDLIILFFGCLFFIGHGRASDKHSEAICPLACVAQFCQVRRNST